jgi:hypothetical protein
MQERLLAARGDRSRGCQREPGCQAFAAERWVRADGADLSPARRAQPLARHGYQRAVPTDAEVTAELDSSRQEWPWPCSRHQVEHLGHVSRAERDCVGVRFSGY